MSRRKQPNPAKLGDADTNKASETIGDSPPIENHNDESIQRAHAEVATLKNGIGIEKKCIQDSKMDETDDEEREDLDDGNDNEDVDTIAMDDQEDSLGE